MAYGNPFGPPPGGVTRPRGHRARRAARRAAAARMAGLQQEYSYTGTLSSSDVAKAVSNNRVLGQSVGWKPYYHHIAQVVGFTAQTPTEEAFARAVAVWQARNGLTPDGIIGPMTWGKLQPLVRQVGAPLPSWTSPGNSATRPGTPTSVSGFLKDVARLQSASMPPSSPITVDSRWSRDRQALARTYNRLGGLMRVVASELGIDVEAVLAVWRVESGGREHTVGRAIIRFENHVLWDRWGKSNSALFQRHFRYSSSKRWEGHEFRESASGAWETVHTGKQETEYRVLELARRLAGDTALECISMGGPQIMGFSARDIGYASARAMYDAFQASERAHVLGFFDFCRTKPAPNRGDLIRHIQQRNWREVARYYNGPGQVDVYGPKIEHNYNEARQLPLGASRELGFELDGFELGDFEGDFETGDYESGGYELGYGSSFETGDFELGDFETGDFESGDYESGDFEAQDYFLGGIGKALGGAFNAESGDYEAELEASLFETGDFETDEVGFEMGDQEWGDQESAYGYETGYGSGVGYEYDFEGDEDAASAAGDASADMGNADAPVDAGAGMGAPAPPPPPAPAASNGGGPCQCGCDSRWSTADGHTLRIAPGTVDRVLTGLIPPWRRRRKRPSDRRAALRQLGWMARGARRVGSLRNRRTGARFPVFSARAGGRSFNIVTRPRGRWQGEIVLVRPGEGF